MSAEDIDLALVNDALTERVLRETTSVQTEWTGRVTSKDLEGIYYVDITGGATAMPCVRSLVDVRIGQIVDVRIQNGHAVITGCRSDPVATSSSVNVVEKKVTMVRNEVQIIRTEKADVTELTAAKAEITELRAGIGEFETVVTQDLIAANADITNLKAKDVTIEGALTAANADITNLKAKDVTIDGRLDAAEADIDDLEADTAKIHNLTADQLTATVGYIGNLTAGNITAANIAADHATLGNLDTNYAHITNGVIDNATINQAKVNDLAANYAKIDGANITTATIRDAWVDKLMVQSGLIAHEGAVYELDAIQVNASNIKAGTLDVERLVITQNGQKYLVHVNAQGTPTYEKLDGNIIEDLTITADKIVAGAITAQKITTENLVGSGGWINLRNGTFNYTNATTGDGMAWDGQHLTINAASIDAKVNKDGVIAAINLSTETEGGSAVKISADKVNIEGAAIFTGSGRLSQSSLDGAYDASGAATGAVNALKTDLASSSGTTVINGGNIITGTVTANQLSANSVTADKIASNAITVGKMPSADQASILNSNVTIGNVNGLQDALNGKETAGAAAAVESNLTDDINSVSDDAESTANLLQALTDGLSQSNTFSIDEETGEVEYTLDSAMQALKTESADNVSAAKKELTDRMNARDEEVDKDIAEAKQANLYLHFDEESDGLEIGKNLDGTAGVFRQLMDDQGTHWQYNREDAAYVGVNDEGLGTMFLDEAQVTGRFRIGNYVFLANDDGTRMSLKWIGE